MKAITYKLNNTRYDTVLFAVLIAFLFSLMFVYSYLINASVSNVVERKNAENAIYSLEDKISISETDYFKKTSELNIKLAKTIGFKETNNTSFAVRKTTKTDTISLSRF